MQKREIIKYGLAVIVIMAVVVFVKTKPRPVVAQTVASGPFTREVMGTGTLEARVKTIISPRIQERINAVLVDQGDFVKANQLLVSLDDADARAQVETAKAALEVAQASVVRVSSDAERAAAVEKASKLNHGRAAELFAKQMISQEEMDKVFEAFDIAKANLKMAQAAIIEAKAQVLTAEKALESHLQRLGYTRIESPFDGLVVRRDRDPGGVVVPGSSILTLIATNELWISSWVNEVSALQLATGQSARVVFRSTDKEFAGTIARLGHETDRETREFVVDVLLHDLPNNWTIGQRAEVFIATGHSADAVQITPEFIIWRGVSAGVFVPRNGKAHWQAVEIGSHSRGLIEIKKGLAPGDQIIRPGGKNMRPLKDGQRIINI